MKVNVPAGDGGGILLDIDGMLITVLLIDRPLPPDAYAAALSLNRVWPAGRAVLQGHRAGVGRRFLQRGPAVTTSAIDVRSLTGEFDMPSVSRRAIVS